MTTAARIAIDLALLLGFALPHSLLLRRGGREAAARLFPRELFYTVYGLVSSLSLLLLYALWQPLPGTIWSARGPAAGLLLAGHAGAWALMAWSLFHYGPLRQPGIAHWLAYVRGRKLPSRPFPTTGPFRHMRHPIYLAMLLMIWITPWMTPGHLLVATVWSAYIGAGVLHKEVRLRRTLGQAWIRYAARVPALPGLGIRPRNEPQEVYS